MARVLFLLLALLAGRVSAQAQPPQLRAEPTGAPLVGEFTRIAGAVLWPDGSVVVGDNASSVVTRYSPRGAVQWSEGRGGAGPGEYRALRSVVRCTNGQLATYDISLRRTTFYNPDDGTVTSSRVDPGLGVNGHLLWCADSTRMVMSMRRPEAVGPRPVPGSSFDEPRQMVEYGPDRLDLIATGRTPFYFTGGSFSDIPFGERAEEAGGGNVVVLCQLGAGTCTTYNMLTRHRSSFTVQTPARAVTDADWQHEREIREAGLGAQPEMIRAGFRGTYNGLPRPAKFGQFEMVRVDDLGRVWVRTYVRYRQATALWYVLDAESGAQVAHMILPAGVEPLAWAGNMLVGTHRDADGVPVVRRYRVTR